VAAELFGVVPAVAALDHTPAREADDEVEAALADAAAWGLDGVVIAQGGAA
jgi:hypothetical protein